MLYCILGKSGSGKDTLLKEVLKDGNNLKIAVSHTTRPKRSNEIDGVDYHYINKETFLQMEKNNKFIETRVYTVIDEETGKEDTWYYGLSYEALNGNENKFVIVDVQGLDEIISKLKKENIISFCISADENIRKERYLKRDIMSKEKIEEMERRFVADNNDFSLKKLKNIDFFLNNDNFEDLNYNKSFILSQIEKTKNKQEKVQCMLVDHTLKNEITKLNVYPVLGTVYGEIKIINDLGKVKWYPNSLFRNV